MSDSSSTDEDLTPAEKAARTRAAKAAERKGTCASDGCGHKLTEHDLNRTTCWADGGQCPCRGYKAPGDEDVD